MFTINNPDDLDAPRKWTSVVWCVWQVERGVDAGTEHLQGYVIFAYSKTLSEVKLVNCRAHWEPRHGTHKQAKDYCQKEETRVAGPYTIGEEPPNLAKQGKVRRTLDDCVALVKGGQTVASLLEDDELRTLVVRNYRGLMFAASIFCPKRSWKTQVIVLVGPTGTGKSRAVADNHSGAYWLPKGKWWDGYRGEEVVCIDDFYGWLPLDYMLRLLDRYPMLVETKGGSVQMVAKAIYITSNIAVEFWYEHCAQEHRRALQRRVDVVCELMSFPGPKRDEPLFLRGGVSEA